MALFVFDHVPFCDVDENVLAWVVDVRGRVESTPSAANVLSGFTQ
jgi:hypothetical protein